jgi:hypothetical protein
VQLLQDSTAKQDTTGPGTSGHNLSMQDELLRALLVRPPTLHAPLCWSPSVCWSPSLSQHYSSIFNTLAPCSARALPFML